MKTYLICVAFLWLGHLLKNAQGVFDALDCDAYDAAKWRVVWVLIYTALLTITLCFWWRQ